MSQTQRIGKTATRVYTDDDGALCCQYHSTVVAKRKGWRITLDTGGWRTATTKTRMNQFANELCNSTFSVYQKRGEWYVETAGRVLRFERESITFFVAPELAS